MFLDILYFHDGSLKIRIGSDKVEELTEEEPKFGNSTVSFWSWGYWRWSVAEESAESIETGKVEYLFLFEVALKDVVEDCGTCDQFDMVDSANNRSYCITSMDVWLLNKCFPYSGYQDHCHHHLSCNPSYHILDDQWTLLYYIHTRNTFSGTI